MQTRPTIKEVQAAFDYKALAGMLRSGGIGSIVFGAIAVVMGISTVDQCALNGILAVIGAGLVVEGICVMLRPSPGGLILDGTAMMVVGGWNIFITLASMDAGGGVPFFGVLGGYQIFTGFKTFAKYPRFAGSLRKRPPAAALKCAEELMAAITSKDAGQATRTVAFSVGNEQWRVGFHDEIAVLVKGAQEEVVVTDAAHLQLVKQEIAKEGEQARVRLRVGDRRLDAVMAPDALSTYAEWKLAAA